MEQLQIYNNSESHKEHLINLHANPEWKSKNLEQLKTLHDDPEWKSKNLEHLRKLHEKLMDPQNEKLRI